MQLSFVLPFTRRELVPTTVNWRHDPDKCADLRYHLLLQSFVKHFNQADLRQFCILCPSHDCGRAEDLLRAVTDDPRYEVLSEDLILSADAGRNGSRLVVEEGWYIQQILKMGMARHISTDFFVTMDSDVVCMRPFGGSDLMREVSRDVSGALVNIETRADYERIYKSTFAENETAIKEGRYGASAALIGYKRAEEHRGRYYGETPCVIHTRMMQSLLNHIEARHQDRWQHVLARSRGWTEYGLYFQFLEMTRTLNALYDPSHCNRVLDLERSVWQANEWYRRERIYDQRHFLGNDDPNVRGIFVAVQSWLPLASWLPSRYRSLGDFYAELTNWVLHVPSA
jgi:hypothetical protein